MAEVETAGVRRWCSTVVQPTVRPGDHVLTQANLVLEVVSESEARDIEEAFAHLVR